VRDLVFLHKEYMLFSAYYTFKSMQDGHFFWDIILDMITCIFCLFEKEKKNTIALLKFSGTA